MDGGEAFPERGVSGAGRALTVLSGGVVLDVSREVLLPFFLGWHQPFPAPIPFFPVRGQYDNSQAMVFRGRSVLTCDSKTFPKSMNM